MARDAQAPGVESSILLRKSINNVELLTLNRSSARNSLSESTLTELKETFDDIGKNANIFAVVLGSTGPAFCAGHDLKELKVHRDDPDNGQAYYSKIMNLCSSMMQTIVSLPQPVIAAVQGIATAAGCQLVASCDLAVASSAAKFATPGVDIGLFCSTPMVALSRNVSRKHALEMLLTGELISAEHAFRIGLINRIVTPGSEIEEALSLANLIASKSRQAIKIGKKAFYKQCELDLSDAYEYASKIMVENLLSADAQEGVCAFIEKRSPRWQE